MPTPEQSARGLQSRLPATRPRALPARLPTCQALPSAPLRRRPRAMRFTGLGLWRQCTPLTYRTNVAWHSASQLSIHASGEPSWSPDWKKAACSAGLFIVGPSGPRSVRRREASLPLRDGGVLAPRRERVAATPTRPALGTGGSRAHDNPQAHGHEARARPENRGPRLGKYGRTSRWAGPPLLSLCCLKPPIWRRGKFRSIKPTHSMPSDVRFVFYEYVTWKSRALERLISPIRV